MSRHQPDQVQAQAFWVTGPSRGELRAEPLPDPGTDEVLIRARFGMPAAPQPSGRR